MHTWKIEKTVGGNLYKLLIKYIYVFTVEPFELREFSFRTVEEKFSRYESFENEKELFEKLLKLIPNRIDVGPIYNKR